MQAILKKLYTRVKINFKKHRGKGGVFYIRN